MNIKGILILFLVSLASAQDENIPEVNSSPIDSGSTEQTSATTGGGTEPRGTTHSTIASSEITTAAKNDATEPETETGSKITSQKTSESTEQTSATTGGGTEPRGTTHSTVASSEITTEAENDATQPQTETGSKLTSQKTSESTKQTSATTGGGTEPRGTTHSTVASSEITTAAKNDTTQPETETGSKITSQKTSESTKRSSGTTNHEIGPEGRTNLTAATTAIITLARNDTTQPQNETGSKITTDIANNGDTIITLEPGDNTTGGGNATASGSPASTPSPNGKVTTPNTSGDIVVTLEPVENVSSIVHENNTMPHRNETVSTPSPVESNWTACTINPCQNNGTCVNDTDLSYHCRCEDGFTGLHCQVVDECVVKDDQLCDQGACVYQKNGLRRSCVCFYGKYWDADQKMCREPDPPRFPNPCQNGGTYDANDDSCACINGTEGDHCEVQDSCGECSNGECVFDDDETIKYCKCKHGFYWDELSKKCRKANPPCHPSPCNNGGSCVVSNSSANCSCPTGFTGTTCELLDFCTAYEDDEGCSDDDCVELQGMLTCKCEEGYFLDAVTHRCGKKMKPCFPNPCSNYGLCTPVSSDEYNCTCSEGYVGTKCQEPDYCVLNGGDEFCAEADCGYDKRSKSGVFYCVCGEGEFFDYVNRTCKKIDFCPIMKCEANAYCLNNTCHCKEHYKWNNETGKCEANFCASNPCPSEDMTCTNVDGVNKFKCSCKKGSAFDGTKCNDAALCTFPNMNACDQACTVIGDGNYTCGCISHNFELNEDKFTCKYTGNETCSNETCETGLCVKEDGHEACLCSRGFEEDETGRCVDLCAVDHLPDGICPDNKCESIKTGYRCKCEGKYILSDDDTTCTVRKVCNEWEAGGKACQALNAECVEKWESSDGYTCQCKKGQIKVENVCTDPCSIAEKQKACAELNAVCSINGSGDAVCKCPPFYLPFEKGTKCSQPAPISYLLSFPLNSASYLKSNGNVNAKKRSLDTEDSTIDYQKVNADVNAALKELVPALEYTNVLICRQQSSYLKCRIEIQLSSVVEESLRRLRRPEICLGSGNSSNTCLLPPSLVLQKNFFKSVVSVQETNPCDPDIKNSLCGTETDCHPSMDDLSFNCTCKSGYAMRSRKFPFDDTKSIIDSCNNINECAAMNPCPENMVCKDLIGSYECSCKAGYRNVEGEDPLKCVKICDPSPCVHGICQEVGSNGLECRCDPGYTGQLCDLEDKNFKRVRKNVAIVGGVLGGALLVTIILFVACVTRLKKKKVFDDPNGMLYGTEMVERRRGDMGAINNAYQRD